jgi:hypothetical protein
VENDRQAFLRALRTLMGVRLESRHGFGWSHCLLLFGDQNRRIFSVGLRIRRMRLCGTGRYGVRCVEN